ncbi:hypothetical protein [Sphingobacterium bovistauri]|uniref:DUF4960 domain-containing protein n=1 Tax=Sphingobacterium bovistauri TaxID=2781959 RepID=A0ABS7Z335_9SPHI|nr:hypothetical protein [Sphingobacterium bovistauri]MCA5004567.1 hypothetical protein [Sphingobacterium bovistauri]
MSSCTKEKKISSEENSKIIFNVIGIKNYDTDLGKNTQTQFKSKNTGLSNQETQLTSKVYLNEYATEGNIGEELSSNVASKTKLSATETMSNGITYRIILYYKDNNQFAKSFQCVAGTPFEISVQQGREYIWYAYSYNNNEDISQPDPTNPTITTPIDKDLLWATSGPAGVVSNSTGVSLPITFTHKLAQIYVKINTKSLYGNITDIDAEFSQNYTASSSFSILSGITSGGATVVSVGALNFTPHPHPDSTHIIQAKYYTSSPSLINSYKVTIKSLSVQYVNGSTANLIVPATPREATFETFTPQIGKSHIGNLKLHHLIGQKKILHLAISTVYGYGAEAKAARNMITDTRNFGNNTNSLVKIASPYTHVNSIATSGTNALNTYIGSSIPNIDQPDIIIIGYYYYFLAANNTEINLLKSYVDKGGVLILMTDDDGTAVTGKHLDFLRLMYSSSVTMGTTGYGPGSIYKLNDIDDMILNGPFGNGKYTRTIGPQTFFEAFWGEDSSITWEASGIPETSIYSYSGDIRVGETGTPTATTFFRDRTKNFIWIGDAGFLANEFASGTYPNTLTPSLLTQPFATNNNNFPIRKAYGLGIVANHREVANSILFANMMAWAYMRSEFFGINTGGLRL